MGQHQEKLEHNHYVEPFFGGGSVLLQKPDKLIEQHSEVVNDINGELTNFWRVLKSKDNLEENRIMSTAEIKKVKPTTEPYSIWDDSECEVCGSSIEDHENSCEICLERIRNQFTQDLEEEVLPALQNCDNEISMSAFFSGTDKNFEMLVAKKKISEDLYHNLQHVVYLIGECVEGLKKYGYAQKG